MKEKEAVKLKRQFKYCPVKMESSIILLLSIMVEQQILLLSTMVELCPSTLNDQEAFCGFSSDSAWHLQHLACHPVLYKCHGFMFTTPHSMFSTHVSLYQAQNPSVNKVSKHMSIL